MKRTRIMSKTSGRSKDSYSAKSDSKIAVVSSENLWKKYKRIILVIWLFIAVVLILLGVHRYYGSPTSIALSATIKSSDAIAFSYGGNSNDHISPICGCWKEQSAESWRGITFASRQYTISRSGTVPLTAYVINSPWPAKMSDGGPWMGLSVQSFGPISTGFDLQYKLSKLSTQALASTDRDFEVSHAPQYAIIVSDGPIHLKTLSEVPLGSWIPMGHSTVKIDPKLTLFPSSSNIIELTESYRNINIGTPRGVKKSSFFPDPYYSQAELPALDLLGGPVLLWTESPNSSVWISHRNGQVLRSTKPNWAVGLVVDPVFSIRVKIIPTTQEALDRFANIEKSSVLPQPHDWLGVSESGSISLHIDRPKNELEQFGKIIENIALDDKREGLPILYPREGYIADSGESIFYYEKRRMDFRYPPSPPTRGFNAFGKMNYLEFERAHGSLILGSKATEITSPSKLEFKGIDKFKAAEGMMPIAVRGAEGSSDAKLAFSGVSEVLLNGEPLVRRLDEYAWTTNFSLLVAGVIQGIIAFMLLVMDVYAKRYSVNKK